MINRVKLYSCLQKVLLYVILFDLVFIVLNKMNIRHLSFDFSEVINSLLVGTFAISIIPGYFLVTLVYLVLRLDLNNQMQEAGVAIGILINVCLYVIVREKKNKYLKNEHNK